MGLIAARANWSRTTALLASSVLALAGCAGEPRDVDPPRQEASANGRQFFTGAGSPWVQPVPPDAPSDPRSARFAARLAEGSHLIALRTGVPVYLADAGTTRYPVTPTAPWAGAGATLPAVPIPDRASPDPNSGGRLAVLDSPSGCVYELYGASRTTEGGWTAEWVNALPADGTGVYPDGRSTRSSGISVAAGLIWPDELRSGRIAHALVFSYPMTRRGGPVGIATVGDGVSGDPDALPIGAHVVLDPAVDIDTLGLSPAVRTVARALQEYGMVLADGGGSFALSAVHPQSFAADPWASTFGGAVWADIGKIPFDRMKVLPLEPQRPRYVGPPIGNRCTSDPVSPPGADGTR